MLERGHASYSTWRMSVHTLGKKGKGTNFYGGAEDEPKTNYWSVVEDRPRAPGFVYMHFVCIV
jgi:hypothetical protein